MNAILWKTVPLRSLGDAVAKHGACQAVVKHPSVRLLVACSPTGVGPGVRAGTLLVRGPPASKVVTGALAEASMVLRLTLK